jgi:putative ABC transport system permease protein
MCCAYLSNLLLARGAARTREIAVRSALGANRRRIAQQLLLESGLLSIGGGALGAGVGALILSLAPRVVPPGVLPATVTLTFDVRILAFCTLIAAATGVLFGMAPAWQATRVSPVQARGASRTVVGGDGRLRTVLTTAQVAVAVVLLFGAGLLVRTLMAVDAVDRGYQAREVLTMIVDPPGNEYPTPQSMAAFYAEVSDAVAALPGVERAAWSTTLPMGRSYQGLTPFAVADGPLPDEDKRPRADYQIVSPPYFRTIDLPIVLGRPFGAQDTDSSAAVCIVNEEIVRRLFPDRSPLGAQLVVGDTIRQVVGVARQVKRHPAETEALLQIYAPLSQNAPGDVFLLVRPSAGRAASLGSPVRAAIGRIDRAHVVSVRDVKSLDDVAGEATSRHRFRAVLAATFAGLAVTLAAVGLFGLVAYSTELRLRDFGVRRALGATASHIAGLVAAGALRVATAGAVVGLLVAAVLVRTMGSMLYGVQPLDPTTFAFVLMAVVAVVASATVVPALRALRVNPAIFLRGD